MMMAMQQSTVLAAAEQRLDILFEERRTEMKLRAAGLLEAAPNRPVPGPETMG